MSSIKSLLVSSVLGIFAGLAPTALSQQKGLYGDETKDVTTGDLNSQDYWWAKYDNMMLDLALKQHQPEGRIGLNLVSSIKRLEDLTKQYPKHEEIKKWKQHAEEIQAKIDPNADRTKALSPECPWEESNFAQLWVNFYRSKSAFDAKDYDLAQGLMQNVMQNYEILLKPDRMKDYPEDLRKWVIESKPAAEKLQKEIKDKQHH